MFQGGQWLSFELHCTLAGMTAAARLRETVRKMGRNCDRARRNQQETSLFIILCSLLWFKYLIIWNRSITASFSVCFLIMSYTLLNCDLHEISYRHLLFLTHIFQDQMFVKLFTEGSQL